ncbi:hypothetical protein DITRI_Ditri08aG0073900 [Diplodiscus trichospermus]
MDKTVASGRALNAMRPRLVSVASSFTTNGIRACLTIDIRKLKHLQRLDLHDNLIQNASHLCWGKGDLPSLYSLDLSHNNLTELKTESRIWFPSLNMNVLNLAGCNLRKVPSYGVGGQKLSGSPPKTFGNTSSQLTSLYINNNSFHGPLPEDIDLIFPELIYLDASLNGFNGDIPPSLGNNLRGEKFPRNSSLPKLKILALGNNDFSNTFLDSLSWSLSQPAHLPQLRVLVLRNNRLEGQIPQQLCQMRHLSILDLAGNYLSGDIPDCVDNITSWSTAARRDAQMRISAANNILHALDLSCNKLSGSIPVQITRLKAMIVLNLSHNLLTGVIPQGNQFGTFSNDSYVGNHGLCGYPLSSECDVVTEKPSYATSSRIWPPPLLFPWTAFILFTNVV